MKPVYRWLIADCRDTWVNVLGWPCLIGLGLVLLWAEPAGRWVEGQDAADAGRLTDPVPVMEKINLVAFQSLPGTQEQDAEQDTEQDQVLGRDWVTAGRERRDSIPPNVVPVDKRWKIDHGAENISQYAKQLSFLGLDIGIVQMTSPEIIRLRDVGGKPQVIESTRAKERTTLWFTHTNEKLKGWDETLARQNGVDLENRFTALFYTTKNRAMLRQMESAYLEAFGWKLSEVRQTRFKIVPVEDRFEFRLIGIRWREPPLP